MGHGPDAAACRVAAGTAGRKAMSLAARSLLVTFALAGGCVAAGALVAGCSKTPSPATTADALQPAAPAAAPGMTLTSPDFAEGRPIPREHASAPEGANRPPRLAWSDLPPGTRELALIVDDPDAPRAEPWVHDVLYKIPVDANPEEMALRGAAVDSTARFVQGVNSWGRAEWGGPLPPPGAPHHYFFRLYALDVELDAAPGLTKAQLLEQMQGHVLGTATLIGTYQR
jgi:Raf kinase inhibitor-like YbhB/YbcL family protein